MNENYITSYVLTVVWKKISSDTCTPEAIGVIISFNWKFSVIVVINQGKYSVLELTDMTSRVPMLATSFEVL